MWVEGEGTRQNFKLPPNERSTLNKMVHDSIVKTQLIR
jgi:hypothetical protein